MIHNKKRLFLFFLTLLSFASLEAKPLDFYFTVKRYLEPKSQVNYVEFAYLIPGNIPKYIEVSSDKFQAEVLLVLDLINAKQETVFNHSYVLQSPIYSDNPENLNNLSDVLNLKMSEDSLELQIQVLDINDSTAYFTDRISLNQLPKKNRLLSDIALISAKKEGEEGELFYKAGYIFIPKFINYYPTEITKLGFYVEAYQKDSVRRSFIKYFISDENNVVIEKYSNFKKLNSENFDALYTEFDISALPSGNYYVYAELRNDNNALIDRKRMYFQRFNNTEESKLDNVDYYELDVIKNNFAQKYDLRNITHHINALKPIAEGFEKAAIDGAINGKQLDLMHNYFFSFWIKRDSKNPEERWKEYAKKLQFVDLEFGNSLIEGHQTSRGYVYLKHGKPYERIERNTSSYGAIEIWRYEILEGQGNIEFLFIENNIFDDEFQLVHSNLNNEMFNREWSQILKSNNF